MGMSASQMRYVLVTERKSDVEFQGQQINQQRTTLATQSSAYTAQLLDLTVPTPPSSDDFTKTTYTFKDASNATCTITGTLYDPVSGTYTVNYTTTSTGSQGENGGVANFVNTSSPFAVPNFQLYNPNTGTLTEPLSLVDTTSGSTQALENLANLSTICQDLDIVDANGKHYGENGYIMPAFYSYASGGTTRYVQATDLQANAGTGLNNLGNSIPTYYVDDNAAISSNGQITGATIQWSDSGRMESITDSHNNPIPLNIATTKDDAAYNDAMNEYDYQQTLYSQKMDQINAHVSILQAQDKKLELKLKDLDTQQQALSTEMDSLKKVIDKNVETSFKTFG
ncbi:MAG: hypothetical protein WCY19_03855 [Candidatus Gastranaerophilaceae bacterium]